MADALRAAAHAKVNLSLLVGAPDRDGYHPLRSLALSVAWADRLTLSFADDDEMTVAGDAPEGEANLAWRALAAVRDRLGTSRSAHLDIVKAIPSAAGLGGGSADAAAALVLASDLYGAPESTAASLAPDLGADVPFCLVGGMARLEGRGERVQPQPLPSDFALALAVPPLHLSTAAVYAAWDRLEGPEGPALETRRLPPSLRGEASLRNDLYPAAVALAPDLADWRAELSGLWDRPVAMTGSGPALFAYFVDLDEARAACAAVPGAARGAHACSPAARGVARDGGTLT